MSVNGTRCGFVAVVGAPNAGKSTLVNALVGGKVTIVSPKVQTTRFQVRGIMMRGSSQVILVDTPGIFAPKRRLERAMVSNAWSGVRDADQALLMVDAKHGLDNEVERILDGLSALSCPVALALNKVDLVPRPDLLGLAAALSERRRFEAVFMIAALKGDGVDDLADHLAAAMPQGPYLFPEDDLSDLPQRMLAAEITREQVFLQLHDELPYQVMVETLSWIEQADGAVRIDQEIYVQRPGQKGIVLGEGGRKIRSIGARARMELEEMLERRVHLFLHVKVQEDLWDRPEHYRHLGLDFDPDGR